MLSIAIPTYNRAKLLDLLIRSHIKICIKHNIQILISDNSSTDHTQEIISKWQKKTTLIKSTRSEITLSPGQNIELALSLSSTSYTWLLGDSYQLSEDLIDHVIKKIQQNHKYDLFVINLGEKLSTPQSKLYADHNLLLADLGGIMTCLSCLIFHEKILKNGAFKKYRESRFTHLGVALDFLGQSANINVVWIQEKSVTSLSHLNITKAETYHWSLGPDVIEIGFRNWVNFVFSLPDTYLQKNKLACVKSFGKITKLATIKGFLLMRMRGQLTNEIYKKYKFEINLVGSLPSIIVRLISIFPKWLIKILYITATKFLNFFLRSS
ncbi:glycosyltransferase family 2 protein [Candidatus Thioglobus sp.]|nr:glycosyltransferase family 2 protein [Candidatus Thioglobus sp.]